MPLLIASLAALAFGLIATGVLLCTWPGGDKTRGR